jgi:hypothetical protein
MAPVAAPGSAAMSQSASLFATDTSMLGSILSGVATFIDPIARGFSEMSLPAIVRRYLAFGQVSIEFVALSLMDTVYPEPEPLPPADTPLCDLRFVDTSPDDATPTGHARDSPTAGQVDAIPSTRFQSAAHPSSGNAGVTTASSLAPDRSPLRFHAVTSSQLPSATIAQQAQQRLQQSPPPPLETVIPPGFQLGTAPSTLLREAEMMAMKPVRCPDHLFTSDGGHVENLGILPLLDARCAVILALDGGADPTESCETLLKAISIARRTLRVEFYAYTESDGWTRDVESVLLEHFTSKAGPRSSDVAARTVASDSIPVQGGSRALWLRIRYPPMHNRDASTDEHLELKAAETLHWRRTEGYFGMLGYVRMRGNRQWRKLAPSRNVLPTGGNGVGELMRTDRDRTYWRNFSGDVFDDDDNENEPVRYNGPLDQCLVHVPICGTYISMLLSSLIPCYGRRCCLNHPELPPPSCMPNDPFLAPDSVAHYITNAADTVTSAQTAANNRGLASSNTFPHQPHFQQQGPVLMRTSPSTASDEDLDDDDLSALDRMDEYIRSTRLMGACCNCYSDMADRSAEQSGPCCSARGNAGPYAYFGSEDVGVSASRVTPRRFNICDRTCAVAFGVFPHINTMLQCLTPRHFRAYFREGVTAMAEAYDKLPAIIRKEREREQAAFHHRRTTGSPVTSPDARSRAGETSPTMTGSRARTKLPTRSLLQPVPMRWPSLSRAELFIRGAMLSPTDAQAAVGDINTAVDSHVRRRKRRNANEHE